MWPPDVALPVTVSVYVPEVVTEAATDSESVELVPEATTAGLNEAVTPFGSRWTRRPMDWTDREMTEVPIVVCPDVPTATVRLARLDYVAKLLAGDWALSRQTGGPGGIWTAMTRLSFTICPTGRLGLGGLMSVTPGAAPTTPSEVYPGASIVSW